MQKHQILMNTLVNFLQAGSNEDSLQYFYISKIL